MNLRNIIFFSLIFFTTSLLAQKVKFDKIEPPFWWTGMKHPELQLMVHGENIATSKPEFSYPGVTLAGSTSVENPNYLFLDLLIGKDALPGNFNINFRLGKKIIITYTYQLLARESDAAQHKGFDESDIIYLVFPDRFVNGDTTNDSHPAMLEKAVRSIPDSRHGGDLKGVMDKLDYMEKLGITALWLNPVLENNQAAYSYHGYAISDFYNVDPRIGTNEDFKKLNILLHQRGMKAVMDMVFNHCGIGHWWINDLPSNDWINQWPEYTRSNFRAGTVFDPYASNYDQDRFHKGWFDRNMPDLNQHNRFLQNYLVQNSIWWIEYAGLDGIRMDTYPYPFKDQMAQWAERVMSEYPNFSIVGEVWIGQPALVAPWENNPGVETGYKSNLEYVFDFPMYDAFGTAFNEPGGWNSGLVKLYDVLSHDFLYGEKVNIVTFADNHDGNRLFTKLNENLDSQKMAITFLLTSRGVPQIYYGTEILMTGDDSNGHGRMRKDFPGGWTGDETNKFETSGRTANENEMFDHLTTLTHWRNNNKVSQLGKLKHFIPENNMYVYFRYDDEHLVMVILNNSDKNQNLNTETYVEMLDTITIGKNIFDNKNYTLNEMIIPAKSSFVLELK